MNKLLLKLFSIFPFLLLQVVDAQWSQIISPSISSVSALETCGSYIFAGTECGIFRSNDNGSHWIICDSGLSRYFSNNPQIDAIIVDSNRIFTVIEREIFISYDTGNTWVRRNADFIGNQPCAFAKNGNKIYINDFNHLKYSIDDGATWKLIDIGLSVYNKVISIATTGNNIFVGTDTGVYRSNDNGTSWAVANSGIPSNIIISKIVADNNIVIASDYIDFEVYFSIDNGLTWSSLTGIPNLHRVDALTNSGKDILIGTDCGVYSSADSGRSWIPAGLNGIGINDLKVNGGLVIAGTTEGISLTYSNGQNWVLADSGLTINLKVLQLAANKNTIFAGTEKGLFYSFANNLSWKRVSTSTLNTPINGYVSDVFAEDSNVFAIVENKLFHSFSNETNWSKSDSGVNSHAMAISITKSGNNFLLSTNKSYENSLSGYFFGNVYLSTNNGSSWASVLCDSNATFTKHFSCNNYSFAFAKPLFQEERRTIYSSLNNGMAWTQTNSIPKGRFSSFIFKDSLIIAGTYDQGVYTSYNNGVSWTPANAGFPDSIISVFSLVVNDRTIFAGTSKGVFILNDNKTSWVAFNDGLIKPISSLTIYRNNIYGCTGVNEIWVRPLADVGHINNQEFRVSKRLSDVILLSSIYSRQKLSVRFFLPYAENVTVKLYDLSGIEIITLLHQNLQPGSHEIICKRHLASGYYMIKYIAGPTSCVKGIYLLP